MSALRYLSMILKCVPNRDDVLEQIHVLVTQAILDHSANPFHVMESIPQALQFVAEREAVFPQIYVPVKKDTLEKTVALILILLYRLLHRVLQMFREIV